MKLSIIALLAPLAFAAAIPIGAPQCGVTGNKVSINDWKPYKKITATLAICAAMCHNNKSKCKSYAIASGTDCRLYDVPVALSRWPDPSGTYTFYNERCRISAYPYSLQIPGIP